MIFNMHIRNDWRMLGLHDDPKRVRTLCGKLTAPKYTGVPVISLGQAAYVSEDGLDVGWCLACCRVFVKDAFRLVTRINDHRLHDLYVDMVTMASRQLMLAQEAILHH